MEGLANFEVCDIDLDDLGKVFWKAANFYLANTLLKKTAVGLDAICLTDGLNRNLSCDFLRHGNSLKINMKDLATNRVMLNLLDKGKLVFSGLAILDFEIDKNVLTNRVGKENLQIPVADFEVFRGLARAVNNGGNRSA